MLLLASGCKRRRQHGIRSKQEHPPPLSLQRICPSVQWIATSNGPSDLRRNRVVDGEALLENLHGMVEAVNDLPTFASCLS